MPIEARDRLVRPLDIATVFARRRSGILGILSDEPEASSPTNGSTQHGLISAGAARGNGGGVGGAGRRGGIVRANLGTPRANVGRGRNLQRSPLTIGRENTPLMSGGRHGRGRGTHSVLPAWYPRTPLRDITAVVRAIERRRARLREVDGQETEMLQIQGQRIPNSSMPLPGAQLEHDISMISPNPTARVMGCPPSVGKVPKILLNVTNQASGESEFLTPQKKLLNSIDTVEKEVMEELRKLKRTPAAQKAAREKKVRTLMSMR